MIATTSSEEKAKKVKELGATHVINYRTNPKWDEEVLTLVSGEWALRSRDYLTSISGQTGGVGVDHTIEVGGPGTIVKSFNSTRMGGSIHTIGFLGVCEFSLPRKGSTDDYTGSRRGD